MASNQASRVAKPMTDPVWFFLICCAKLREMQTMMQPQTPTTQRPPPTAPHIFCGEPAAEFDSAISREAALYINTLSASLLAHSPSLFPRLSHRLLHATKAPPSFHRDITSVNPSVRRPSRLRAAAVDRTSQAAAIMASASAEGKAPDPTDFANYFCTYGFLYHQVPVH